MPFCLAVIGHMAIFLATSYSAPAGVCEADIVGGLIQEPLEVVRAETNDLLVPAHSEIVLEGVMRPKERVDEGPFGEYSGYVHGRTPFPVFRVQCITHRKDPIITFDVEGTKTNESQCMGSIQQGNYFYDFLKREMGFPIKDAYCTTEASWGNVIISTEVPYTGYVSELVEACFSNKYMMWNNWVIVVDADVDIRDPRDVMEEFALQCHPQRIIHTDLDGFNHPLNFFTELSDRIKNTKGAKKAYDCTTSWLKPSQLPKKDTFEEAYPPDIQEFVLKNWKSFGFDVDVERKEV